MAEVAVARPSTIDADNAARPYAPSWIDRLTDWVRRLPVPAWIFYLSVALVLVVIRTIAGWSDGSYPTGTFFPLHVLNAASGVYFLALMHYLDDRAGAALDAFRPVLSAD